MSWGSSMTCSSCRIRRSIFDVQIGEDRLQLADFSHLPTHCRFIAFMPQWDFLDFLARQGAQYPGFKLRMRAEVTDLIEEAGRIVGLRATTADGPLEVRASLVVGTDGRNSVVREKADLKIDESGRRWMCCGSRSRAIQTRCRNHGPPRSGPDVRHD